MPVTVKGKPVDAGCYIDGHWGQYGASVLIKIADDLLGTEYWQEANAAEWAEEGMMTDELSGCEELSWMADEAETALNDATTGGHWEWHEGEFFLIEHAECKADDCTEVAEHERHGGNGFCEEHDHTDPLWHLLHGTDNPTT